MTDRQAGGIDPVNRRWLLFLVVSGYLIASFLWRVTTPAHEYALRQELYLTMGLDALALVGLIGLRKQTGASQILFWVALIAGIGLFAIRLTNDSAWWTGHLVYTLAPR